MRQFLLDPFGDPHNKGEIFKTPFGILRDQFERKGIRLDTYDQGDLARADRILFFNHNPALYRKCGGLGIPREKLVLFTFEPSVVIPQQYDGRLWERFGMIFTHDDTRIDGTRVLKLRHPQAKSFLPDTPLFRERKPLVLINANKYSYEPGELYSLRRRAIRYFEEHESGFDLYGHGWADGVRAFSLGNVERSFLRFKPQRLLFEMLGALKPYKSYRGSVDDKFGTLAQYRFCICFENEATMPGYITEKIFDCLVAGTIPIYLGAPNVSDYIPPDAFIDMRKFSGFGEVWSYATGLPEAAIEQMRTAAKDYLLSSKFQLWQPDAVFSSIVEALS